MPSSACSRALRALHSSPTRRSSDLGFSPVRRTFPSASWPGDSVSASFRLITAVAGVFSRSELLKTRPWRSGMPNVVKYSESTTVRLRSEEHTSELQSRGHLVCRLLLAPAPSELYTLHLHDALPILVFPP